jgi:DNA-binding response OmpR family regulator
MAGSLIAVVNDDATFLDLMHDLLTEEGFRVIRWFARDGALAMLERERPALVLLDIRMEEPEAGLLLLREIRASKAIGTTPVIVCTADQRFLHEHAEMLSALRVQTLAKPFDLNALLAKISALLDVPPSAMCG